MYKIFFVSLLIIMSISINSCSPKLAPAARFQQSAIVADGNTNDWSLPLPFTNEHYTYHYNITNDDKNIYIVIISKDYLTQIRMLRSGITVYFDPTGEKNKNISLFFPLRKPDDPSTHYKNENQLSSADQKNEMNQLLLQSDYYGTAGFINMENGQFNIKNENHTVQVALKLNDSLLVYEAIVPLRNLVEELNEKEYKKNFSICVALNNVPNQPDESFAPSHSNYNGIHLSGTNTRIGGPKKNTETKEEDSWYQFHLVNK
jgi:hypothetical protein